MKSLKAFFVLSFVTAVFAFGVLAQSKSPHTVTEFYERLPAKYVAPLAKIKNRRQIIKIEDVAHGYLRLEPTKATPDWEGWAEMALFKKPDGSYLIGIVDGSCSTMCDSGVVFLDYRSGGNWADVTKQVLPNITDRMILTRYRKLFPNDAEYNEQNPPYTNYQLPRQGTTVLLDANGGGMDDNTKLFALAWDGAQFKIVD